MPPHFNRGGRRRERLPQRPFASVPTMNRLYVESIKVYFDRRGPYKSELVRRWRAAAQQCIRLHYRAGRIEFIDDSDFYNRPEEPVQIFGVQARAFIGLVRQPTLENDIEGICNRCWAHISESTISPKPTQKEIQS